MSTSMAEYSVVFLGDDLPPQQIVLLKRSPQKSFAPNMYTGIGGHREESDKNIEATMHRELKEETGLENISLTEFARLVIRGGEDRIIYYAFGKCDPALPLPDCSEGILEWVPATELSTKEIVPTTAAVVQEWAARGFAIDRPFTLFQRQTNTGAIPVVEPDTTPLKEGLTS